MGAKGKKAQIHYSPFESQRGKKSLKRNMGPLHEQIISLVLYSVIL